MVSLYTKKVRPEDIEYGRQLVDEFKEWAAGYGIKVRDGA